MERKTILDYAEVLLTEFNTPLKSTEIARMCVARKLMSSKAKDPVASFANTIDKMVHQNLTARLVHVTLHGKRYVALPHWGDDIVYTQSTTTTVVKVTEQQEQFIKMLLATDRVVTRQDAIQLIFSTGLNALTDELRTKVAQILGNG